MTSIKGTLVAHSTRISMTLAAALAATLVATAAPAEAGDRGLAGAQTAARAAVTPETAEAVHCFRATEQRGASQRRRVFCLVASRRWTRSVAHSWKSALQPADTGPPPG
jgi:hypothetical protein